MFVRSRQPGVTHIHSCFRVSVVSSSVSAHCLAVNGNLTNRFVNFEGNSVSYPSPCGSGFVQAMLPKSASLTALKETITDDNVDVWLYPIVVAYRKCLIRFSKVADALASRNAGASHQIDDHSRAIATP